MNLAALRLSAGLLTVLPVGRTTEVTRPLAARAMLLAPLAVVPLGLVAGLVFLAAGAAGLPTLAVGLLVVGALALGTRALHLDGLADAVDGLGAGDRERALTVMRRGDVGPMGAVALIVVLGLQAAALGAFPRSVAGAVAVLVLVCASRTVLAPACRAGVPAARPDGLGALVAGTVRPVAAVAWAVLGAGLAVLAAALLGAGWWHGLVAAGLAALVVGALLAHVVRRLGGVSGDVLGACVEAAFTALVLVLAA